MYQGKISQIQNFQDVPGAAVGDVPTIKGFEVIFPLGSLMVYKVN